MNVTDFEFPCVLSSSNEGNVRRTDGLLFGPLVGRAFANEPLQMSR